MARHAIRIAHPAPAALRRVDSLQRHKDTDHGPWRRSATWARWRRDAGPSSIPRQLCLAVHAVHVQALPTLAAGSIGEIHATARWLHAGARYTQRGALASGCTSGNE